MSFYLYILSSCFFFRVSYFALADFFFFSALVLNRAVTAAQFFYFPSYIFFWISFSMVDSSKGSPGVLYLFRINSRMIAFAFLFFSSSKLEWVRFR